MNTYVSTKTSYSRKWFVLTRMMHWMINGEARSKYFGFNLSSLTSIFHFDFPCILHAYVNNSCVKIQGSYTAKTRGYDFWRNSKFETLAAIIILSQYQSTESNVTLTN